MECVDKQAAVEQGTEGMMVISKSYVNEIIIAYMAFVPSTENRSYADICMIDGQHIHVSCTAEQYQEALEYLRGLPKKSEWPMGVPWPAGKENE